MIISHSSSSLLLREMVEKRNHRIRTIDRSSGHCPTTTNCSDHPANPKNTQNHTKKLKRLNTHFKTAKSKKQYRIGATNQRTVHCDQVEIL